MSALAGATSIASEVYAFGEFRIDVASRSLRHGDERVPLPSRAFDALFYLIEHRDRLVQKDELVSAVWHDVAVTDDSLVHAISVLRRALADERNQPTYIQTVPRRGYRFVGAVRVIAPVEPPPAAHAGPRVRVSLRRRVAALVSVAAVVAAIAISVLPRGPETAPESRGVRLFQPPPPGTTIVSGGVLSPDGRSLAFVARDDSAGKTALWVRALYSSELKRIDGTEGASTPFWSPDGRRIGFFSNGTLATVDLTGGAPRTVAAVGLAPAGGSWAADDTILFADWASGLYSVRASGGEVTTVTKLDRAARDIAFIGPQFLPDGRHFLYQVVSLDPVRTGSYVGDLDSPQSFRLLDTESPAIFAPPRHLLHVQSDLLIAEEFDVRRLELTGRAMLVARGVSPPSLGYDNVVSAAGGLLAFRHGVTEQNLAWVDRSGEIQSTLSMPTVLFNPRLSPDGSRLLATSSVTSDPGLWLTSLTRAEFERLETDAIAPLWAPDGAGVAFSARGGFDLLVRAIDAEGAARPLLSNGAVKILNDWSPDGTHIVYTQLEDETKLDLWRVRLGDAAAMPLLATPFNEMQARISPDGRWIAYASDESGVLEIYVQRYPELVEKRMVSSGGGGQPQWRADQRELFYLSADRSLVAVAVAADTADTISFGAPRRMFRAPVAGDPDDARDHYAASADGVKFLVDSAVDNSDGTAITVIVNWAGETGDRSRERAMPAELVSRLLR